MKFPKPFRKNQKVKNRKSIRFKKYFLIGGIVLLFFSFLFTTFLTIIFLTQPPVLSPLPKVMTAATKRSENTTESELKRVLQGSTIAVKDIKAYSNKTYVVTTTDGADIIFGADSDIYTQISSLQLIVSRLTMEGKRFTHLDLRYDKPVVTFK